jgi:hypothetical protein
MGALDNTLWLGQFALAIVGAVFASRYYRSIKIIWLYLAFRAGADFLTCALRIGSDPSDLWAAWRWSNYWQQMIQYVLLAALAMRVIGAATNADRHTVRLYGSFAAALCVLGLFIAHGSAPWTGEWLLRIGARANFTLAVLVAGQLLLREFNGIVPPMEKPWPSICSGLLALLSSNAACSELLRHGIIGGLEASRWMAVGQIVALSIFAVGMGQKPKESTEEPYGIYWLGSDREMYRNAERVSQKFEPESVTMVEENRWVM